MIGNKNVWLFVSGKIEVSHVLPRSVTCTLTEPNPRRISWVAALISWVMLFGKLMNTQAPSPGYNHSAALKLYFTDLIVPTKPLIISPATGGNLSHHANGKIDTRMAHKKSASRFTPKNVLNFVFKQESRSSILLIAAAIAALVIANSAWAENYFGILHRHITLGLITLDLQHWINEGLMAIFFLVVVLEVKREFIDGELRSWRKASFLVFTALGGMLLPALIFAAINPHPPESAGWAIPMSTDTAIALGVLGLIGRGVTKSLRVFLLALAIIDDVVSITVIGLFYSQPTNMFALLFAMVLSLLLFSVRTQKFRLLSFIILGLAIWYCLLLAGLSGTIAGVIVAIMAPLTTRRSNAKNLQGSELVEDILLPVTVFVIVPLFVFANAGLDFGLVTLTPGNGLGVYFGVLLGLLIGKPVGIFAAGWLAAKLRIAHKPSGVGWTQILGVGFIAGIGFTIAILIADLAYKTNLVLQHAAVLGVFSASIIAGFIGMVILKLGRRNRPTLAR